MKRTSMTALLVTFVLSAGLGFLMDQILTDSGNPTFTPVIALPLLLCILGAVVLALALPIRRATRGNRPVKIDPFWAFRVAILAKASSLLGVAGAGFSVGLIVYLTTRPVMPGGGTVTLVIVTGLSGLALMIASLVAEYFCTVPKDGDDDKPPTAGVSGGNA